MSKRKKRDKRTNQTIIYKTQHRKLQIEQHEPHLSPALKSGAPEGLDVHVRHVTPTV